MKNTSLQTRLLLTASIVLTIFLGLTGLALYKAYQSSAEISEQGKLESQLYGLLGATELDGKGKLQVGELAEPRFSLPESGLVAEIINEQGMVVWQSSSILGMSMPTFDMLEIDQSQFTRKLIMEDSWFSYSYGFAWEDELHGEHRFSLRVLEHPEIFNQQSEKFRTTLVIWLTAAVLILLVVQMIILRWSLQPLRRIEAEVHQIEKGERGQLTEDYPRELSGLAAGLNLLLLNERRHLQRYRNTLADLAHSIKTPLAVLRGLAEVSIKGGPDKEVMNQTIKDEVSRMDQLVEYQLSKAATSGARTLSTGILIQPVAESILASLQKVYREKLISYSLEIEPDLMFVGEKGDLMEVIGNLLDNACKWCKSSVSLKVDSFNVKNESDRHQRFVIEDDGPGLETKQIETLLQRGSRGDEQTPGHGIGLAVVREIVMAYGGELKVMQSEIGGARIQVVF